MKKIYLFPGKLAVSREPTEITTILGSCVAVALYDTRNRWGGLNHYLLPRPPSREEPSTRYGDFAITELVHEMEALGSERGALQAKVYGGGNVIGGMEIGGGIGVKNIEIALSQLADLRIPVVDKNVGGERGRKIVLRTDTFEVDHQFPGDRLTGKILDPSGFEALVAARDVRVVIVDDSATARAIFEKMFTKHGITVVGTAADAFEARELIVRTKPDVVTLDIEMPRMSGVVFLEKLMKHLPVPVVMVSSLGSQGEAARRALELGAIEFVHKPSQYDPQALKDLAEVLIEKVRAAASTNLLRQRARGLPAAVQTAPPRAKISARAEIRVVVVGGNAGSPESLRKLMSGLAVDTPPVVVADGTISPLLEAFIDKLKRECRLELRVAKDGERLRSGVVYFAPAGCQTRVVGSALEVKPGSPVCGQMPSADVLFESAAAAFGGGVVGVLLSGFGSDGVMGLSKIHQARGATVVESPDSAPFPYGPQKAVAIGVADLIVDSEQLAGTIFEYRNRRAA